MGNDLADMNNDGYKDLILANRNSQPNYIYINDGNLNFNRRVQFGTGRDNTRAIGVADFNKDGYKDIVTANIQEQNVIYFGSKEFKFSNSISQPAVPRYFNSTGLF